MIKKGAKCKKEELVSFNVIDGKEHDALIAFFGIPRFSL